MLPMVNELLIYWMGEKSVSPVENF